jgi:hypothetical protein
VVHTEKIITNNKFQKKKTYNLKKIILTMRFHFKSKKNCTNLKKNLICKKALKFPTHICINLKAKSINGYKKEGNKKLNILIKNKLKE